MYKFNGIKLTGQIAQVRDMTTGEEVQIPVANVSNLSSTDLSRYGIVVESDPLWPDRRFYDTTENPDGSLTSVPKQLSIVISAIQSAIDRERDRRLQLGAPVNFPDGPGVVQTRNADDKANLASRVLRASLMLAGQVASAPIPFIAEDNTVHTMTAAQMVALGDSVDSFVTGMIFAANIKKSTVGAITDFSALVKYDVLSDWPS